MTNSDSTRIETLPFNKTDVTSWSDPKGRHHDWPVVYLLHDEKQIYVGESTRARNRLKQHLDDTQKKKLKETRIILNDEFNKSACLDLESRLIAWFHADSRFHPINRNDGQQNSDYFERNTRYQAIIDEVFNQLKNSGFFTRTVSEIENLNIFKLSPFKALNYEQLVAVDSIIEGLFEDLTNAQNSLSVVQGGPGTGKTIVAIYLLKLLRDIQSATSDPDPEEDGRFSDFFHSGYREQLRNIKIGFVIPQQSLRKTIQRVFKQTPGLNKIKVLSPYTVAGSEDYWDILLIDESHRLTYRGSGMTISQFRNRNQQLFGDDAEGKTAVDWILAKSRHQIFLIDGEQTVRPADVPSEVINSLKNKAKATHRLYSLESQMRVSAGDQYLEFARKLLSNNPQHVNVQKTYDLRFFDSLKQLQIAIQTREKEVGLSRLVAGYAWRWASKGDLTDNAPYDIILDGTRLRWNRTAIDWVASPTSSDEVGSVHTVQGYDLNYAGVIIGPDIRWNNVTQKIEAVKDQHFDTEVGRVKDPDELLEYIQNAYYVLLTRGIRGTYVYVADPMLRDHLKKYFSSDERL